MCFSGRVFKSSGVAAQRQALQKSARHILICTADVRPFKGAAHQVMNTVVHTAGGVAR